MGLAWDMGPHGPAWAASLGPHGDKPTGPPGPRGPMMHPMANLSASAHSSGAPGGLWWSMALGWLLLVARLVTGDAGTAWCQKWYCRLPSVLPSGVPCAWLRTADCRALDCSSHTNNSHSQIHSKPSPLCAWDILLASRFFFCSFIFSFRPILLFSL